MLLWQKIKRKTMRPYLNSRFTCSYPTGVSLLSSRVDRARSLRSLWQPSEGGVWAPAKPSRSLIGRFWVSPSFVMSHRKDLAIMQYSGISPSDVAIGFSAKTVIIINVFFFLYNLPQITTRLDT